MTREEELEIIVRVRSGDTNAFEALVLEHQKKIYNLALRMLGNEEDALDMTQEAFLRAFNSLDGFRGDSKFSVWLYRLSSNICIDFLRSHGKKQASSLTVDGHDEQQEELELPDERFSPNVALEKKEVRNAVYRGLETLSPEYRCILLLREIEGLSYEEIGRALKLEAGTVKSRIFRARKKLCAYLVSDGNIPDNLASNVVKGGAKG
ncbi:MAG TPA: RNA polymerase subunit sigma [Clostridiales bacterium]|jgi:RNA polymerase sigma-70 factor (ECF subfamily)|nr:RNA polymerase subunit sigma [Clostridiales bacterium]HBR08135.1 RNA polymerase subunit sigma [Clostridiales bacterium]